MVRWSGGQVVEVFMMARVVQVVQTVPVVPMVEVIRLDRVFQMLRWSGGRTIVGVCFHKIYGYHALNHQILEKS